MKRIVICTLAVLIVGIIATVLVRTIMLTGRSAAAESTELSLELGFQAEAKKDEGFRSLLSKHQLELISTDSIIGQKLINFINNDFRIDATKGWNPTSPLLDPWGDPFIIQVLDASSDPVKVRIYSKNFETTRHAYGK